MQVLQKMFKNVVRFTQQAPFESMHEAKDKH